MSPHSSLEPKFYFEQAGIEEQLSRYDTLSKKQSYKPKFVNPLAVQDSPDVY